MALKILVAGVEKDQKSEAEAVVKEALGWRALDETWTISLVRMGSMWSVNMDGPDERFRNISLVTSADRLSATIKETIESKGGGEPSPSAAPEEAPAPEPVPAPIASPTPVPLPTPEPEPSFEESFAPEEEPSPVVPTPTPQPPIPTPEPAATPPPPAAASAPPVVAPKEPVQPSPPRAAAPGGSKLIPGEHRDDHGCEHCQGPFVVVYEAQEGDSLQLVPVACPHCWKINLVEIGSWAASGRDYRADKT